MQERSDADMLWSVKIKKWIKSGHTTEEHLDFLYKVIYELADRVEELENELDELKGGNNTSDREIKVTIDRYM